MATLSHTSASYAQPTAETTLWQRILAHAEDNRAIWAAAAILVQGCLLSPAVLLTMNQLADDWQFLLSLVCILTVVISILSVQPVKYIIQAFATSLLIHVALFLFNLLG